MLALQSACHVTCLWGLGALAIKDNNGCWGSPGVGGASLTDWTEALVPKRRPVPAMQNPLLKALRCVTPLRSCWLPQGIHTGLGDGDAVCDAGSNRATYCGACRR